MAYGIIEDGGAGVQTQQPRSGASANLRHPVLRGLSFLWSAAQDKAEVTRRIAPSGYWTTPVLITPTPFGLAGRNAATAATRFDATKFPASTQYTYLAFVLDDAGRGSTRNFFDSDDAGSARIFQFRCTSSNTVEFIAFNTSGGNSSGFTTSATTSSTAPQVIAARSNGDGSLDMFIDGAGKTTSLVLLGTTVKTNSEAGAKYSIGGAAYDAAPFPGGVFWAAGWSRALSDAEIKYISAHPWQLFEADNDPVFYSLGGGTTYNVSVIESATASEIAATGASFLSTISESATASETAAAVASFLSSIAETATASETNASVVTFTSTISETATASETMAAALGAATFAASISETVTASETVSTLVSLQAAISETATASDSISSLVAFISAVSETATASDSIAAQLANQTYAADISETATASDVIVATMPTTYSVSIIETISISDIAAAGVPSSDFWTQISTTQVAGWGQTDNTQSSGWTIIPTT